MLGARPEGWQLWGWVDNGGHLGPAPALRELVEGPAAAAAASTGGKYCVASILSAFPECQVTGRGC